MKDTTDILLGLAGAGDRAAWRSAIEDIAEERGFFDPLGPDHAALFTDKGETLLVTFEEEQAIRGREGHRPLGWALAEPHGWSSLVLVSRGQTWFRDPQVYGFFDRLADDGFFDEFARVVFLGAGPCGYAAAAYSVAAPGATLIALTPQATLTPARAGWDRRFPAARRRDFTSRYGYAPDMAEAAAAAFVVFDPAIPEDAAHAALFANQGAVAIRARHFGAGLALILEQGGFLDEIVAAAAAGTLTAPGFYAALRARRGSAPWQRHFLRELIDADKPQRIARLCRAVLASGRRAPRFRDALTKAEAQISAAAQPE